MIRSFNCASCSAPLDFEGKATQRCEFCGATAIVPRELYSTDKNSISQGQRTSVKFRHDPDVLKATGAVAGGSILISFLVPIIFVLIGGSAALYFALSSTSSANETPAGSTPADAAHGEPSITELFRIGGKGSGTGKFTDNRQVAVDGNGRIYSSNYSPILIQVFDSNGKFLNQWAADAGSNLYDLAADRNGTLYLATNKGLFRFEGESGTPMGRITTLSPKGIAVMWNGNVIVSEGKSISVFDRGLKLQSKIADAAAISGSRSGFDKLAVDGSGMIFALDDSSNDICKFSPNGNFLDRIPINTNSPNAIAVSPSGNIFVSNTSSVHVFNEDGSEITKFKATQAFGMAFDTNGSLYIADRPFVTKNAVNF